MDEEDRRHIENLCTIGFMRTGLKTVTNEEDGHLTMIITAWATPVGIDMNDLRIYHALKRFEYKFDNFVWHKNMRNQEI